MKSTENKLFYQTKWKYSIPVNWTWVTIGELMKVVYRYPTYYGIHYTKHGIPEIRGELLLGNGEIERDLSKFRFISPETSNRFPKTQLKSRDIVISVRGTMGKIGIVRDNLNGANITANLIRLSPHDSIINSDFLKLFFLSNYFKTILYFSSSQTTIKTIRAPVLESITVPLPPINEQKRIVSKLEELITKLDAGIEYLKKNQILLKQYCQSVLKHAFEGKLTEKWRKENHNSIEHKSNLIDDIYQLKDVNKKKEHLKIISNNLIQIPNDWKWIMIRDIALSMKNGIYKPLNFYNEKGIACLRMYNIEEGNIIWKDIKRMNLTENEVKEYELIPGDILVNRVNSRELVGKAATIPHGLETCVYESKNIRLRISNKFTNSKLVSFWFLLYGQRYFNNNAQQTVGMASINQVQLGAMPIPLMSIEEQELLTKEIERRFSIISHNIKNIKIYLNLSKSLHQSILKNAFEGKLVPQDPNDEPAEMLLKRIKRERESSISLKEKSKITKRKSIDNDSKQMRLM